jgi:ABC-type oligopeptide transport system ATPase subunit
MSRAIAVMGESGSGKTTAMRTLNPKETYYIDCDGKGLSWKGWRQQYNKENVNYFRSDNQDSIVALMSRISEKKPEIKNIVIDTANSIMVADEFRRMKEKGYDKWQDLAMSVYTITTTASKLRDDLNVIVLFHVQIEKDENTGRQFTRILTNGKMLNKVGLEKYFTTVLLSKRDENGEYVFETKTNNSTVKTPLDAFDKDQIPNDMQAVLDVLKEY